MNEATGLQNVHGEDVFRLMAAVRHNPIFWAALGGCASLLVALASFGFGSDWEAYVEGSTVLYFILFMAISLVEVLAMPVFFLFLARKGLNDEDNSAGDAVFANNYSIAVMGAMTPCALGLVYYFMSANLPLALLFYLVGLVHISFYYLRMESVITRLLEQAAPSTG